MPDDLSTLFRRLQHEHPDAWQHLIAQAVVDVGGTDAGDLLAIAADDAAAGAPGDTEQALADLEADLGTSKATRADPPPLTPGLADLDLLADLPQQDKPKRSMEN